MLDSGQIESKEFASDLVTIADKASEEYIRSEIKRLFPNVFVVGEEAVAANPELLNQIAHEKMTFVIDPIDGTWNYAKGSSTFGVIISVIANGEVIYGLHYDPVVDDWIHAWKHAGAFRGNPSSHFQKRLAVSETERPEEMLGFIPYYIYGYKFGNEKRDKLLMTFVDFERIMSLRCSAHEYRMMAEGTVDFSLTSNGKLWDHCAGLLIHEEAGGYARKLTGEKYSPLNSDGQLLIANNKDTWKLLERKFRFLLEN